MLNLPLALRIEKNRLVSTAPWLLLLDVTLPNGAPLRLVRNTEDVVYLGNTYSAFAFELGDVRSSGDGRIQGVSLRVANPQRALQPYLEAGAGLVGCAVRLTVVHAGNLGVDHAELMLYWTVLACEVDEEWVSFTLGERFNPRPAREGRAASPSCTTSASRACFNPRPAREGRAARPRAHARRVIAGFNPRPAREGRAAGRQPHDAIGFVAVSILAQPVRAGRRVNSRYRPVIWAMFQSSPSP